MHLRIPLSLLAYHLSILFGNDLSGNIPKLGCNLLVQIVLLFKVFTTFNLVKNSLALFCTIFCGCCLFNDFEHLFIELLICLPLFL